MPAMEKKSLNQPEETNTPEKLKMEAVTIRDLTIRRITAQPGWQWSKHLKPVQKTASCQKDHILCVLSGRLGVRMDDGKEEVFGPGTQMAGTVAGGALSAGADCPIRAPR